MPRLRTWMTIAVTALIVSACGWQASPRPSSVPSTTPSLDPSATPSTEPVSALVTIETRGGECPNGPCGSVLAIEADGRVHATAPAAAEIGMLPDVTLEGLVTEISNADFSALASRPFTGTCPVAFDGQETIYTFGTASGPERIASCEVEVDPSDPLFVAISAALRAVGR